MADQNTQTDATPKQGTPEQQNAGPDEATQKAVSTFEALLKGDITGQSPDDLKNAMKLAQKLLKQKNQELEKQKEEELADQLKPFTDTLTQLQNQMANIEEMFKAKIEQVKAERKVKINEMAEKIQDHLKEYNAKREELGLKPVSMRGTSISTGTRMRTGKDHKYEIKWANDAHTEVEITVDNTYSETINVSPTPRFKDVATVLKNAGLDIGQGGKVRGVINRIRDMKSSVKMEKAEASTAASQ